MDRGPSLFSLCVFIYSIFQTARLSNGDVNLCPCPDIPLVNLTETPPTTCRKIGQTYRYNCTAGYVRKAGTSNRIRCVEAGDQKGQWTPLHLECIRDPRIKTTEPANPPLITDQTELLQVSIIPTTVTETTDIDTTSTAATTSDSLTAGKSNFVTIATHGPAPPPNIKDNRVAFASDPKHIVPPCVALVCVVALVGGICIFWKRRTSAAELPLPPEQIPMAKDPSESVSVSDPTSQ